MFRASNMNGTPTKLFHDLMTYSWYLSLLAVTLIPIEQHWSTAIATVFGISTGAQVRPSTALLGLTSAARKNRRGNIKGSARMATSLNSTLPTQNVVGEPKRGVCGTKDMPSSAKEDVTLNDGASTVVAVGRSVLGVPDTVAGDEAAMIAAILPPQATSTSSTTAAAGRGGAATSKKPEVEVNLTESVDGRAVTPDAAAGDKAGLIAADAPPQVASTSLATAAGGGRGGAAAKEPKEEVHLNVHHRAAVTVVSASSGNSKQGEPSPAGISPSFEGESSPREGESSPPPGGGNSAIRGDGAEVGLDGDRGLGGGADVGCPPSLAEWLEQGPFVLAMAPGFFGYYAHIGALVALEDSGLLEGRVSFATGASGGGLIVGLFAAGLSPRDMGRMVVKFRRSDFWDPIGFGGVLRGQKFESLVKEALPEGVERFDQCRVPLAVSAFDVSRLKTRILTEGNIAPALRATCTFPGLFSPVWHPKGVLIDGGVSDSTGMWCLPAGRQNCRRVLNVTFGYKGVDKACVSPSRFPTGSNPRPDVEIVTLALTGLPRPHPFAMERGADALEAARSQVATVLDRPLLPGKEKHHWIAPLQAPKPQTLVNVVIGKRRQRQSDADEGGSVAAGVADFREAKESSVAMGSGVVPTPSARREQASPEALHRKKRRRTGLWSWHSNEEQSSSECLDVLGCAEAVDGVKLASLATEKVAGQEGRIGEGVGGMVVVESGKNDEAASQAVFSATSGAGENAGAGTSTPIGQVGLASGVDGSGRTEVEHPASRKSGRIPKPKVPISV